MSRGAVLGVLLAVGVIAAGALGSYVQQDRFGGNDEAAAASPAPRDATPAADAPAADATLAAEATLVAVGDCPWGEASCILAQGIERALQAGNVDAVIEFGAPRFYVCPDAPPRGSGGPFPLCQGADSDQGRLGYPVARRFSEGAVVDEEGLRALLQAFVDAIRPGVRDQVGPGGLKLYAFSCTQPAFRVQPVSCARVGIILSAIVSRGAGEPRRELLVFWAVGGFLGRTLPFNEVWEGTILPLENAVLFETGGTLPDLGEVDVIDKAVR